MDVLDWEPDRLKSKLKGTLAKLIDKKEMTRLLRSKDTIAGIRFLGRRLTDKYEGIPLIKRETRKRKKPSRKSLEAALKSCEDSKAKAAGFRGLRGGPGL